MFFQSSKKGIIALDIDGTITTETHALPSSVVGYFYSLYREGWEFIFITGRPFQWGFEVLKFLPFPYHFAVQNGSILLSMPSQTILAKQYLAKEVIPVMESICEAEETDFVIYSGFENGDICYFRPANFSPQLLSYVEQRTKTLKENWQAVDSFENVPAQYLSSLKCFAKEEQAKRLAYQIEKRLFLHVPLNRDPFNKEFFVVQATHPDSNKGKVLEHFTQLIKNEGPVIAAGDDHNDLEMLKVADIKVAMNTAPSYLQEIADVIAPSANEMGIIRGLEEAIHFLGKKEPLHE